MERMLRIHQEIAAGRYPNATTLARMFEIGTKTVVRDLAFMRERLELPIAYDSRKFGFYYSRPVSAFPTLRITQGELFALVVAEKALQQYRGTPFEKPLVSALAKLANQLPDTISFDLSDWDKTISFHTRAEPILDLDVFGKLAEAAAKRRQICFLYRKPRAAGAEERTVDPYHLANINGEWFLFGYDHARRDVRTFVPARMSNIRRTGRGFVRPEGFSLAERLRGSFGVVTGEGEYDVRIRFTPGAAGFIREKRWHPTQQLLDLDGGGVELRMKLSSLTEVQRWILNWGGDAAVISPLELADSVCDAAGRILAAH
jgi:proteasome accessory factor B